MSYEKNKVQEMRKKTEIRRERWKEEDKIRLIEMFDKGVGITQMALDFHRSEKAIFAQINEMRLYERILPPYQKKSGYLCSFCEERKECKEKGKATCNKQVQG